MSNPDQLLTRIKPLDLVALMANQSLPGTTTLAAAITAMQTGLSYACPQCVVSGSNTGVVPLPPTGLTIICPTCGGYMKTDIPYLAVGNSYVALAITGVNTVQTGNTLQLSATVAGGSWYSASTNIATINSSSGLVTPVAAGTSVITYTVNSISVTATITVTVPS